MTDSLWMLPSLPLPDAPADPASEGLRLQFRGQPERVHVHVIDEDDTIVDVIRAPDVQTAYDTARREYPQAVWDGDLEDVT